VAILLLAAIVAYNAWAFLGVSAGGPARIDPAPYRSIVPLESLALNGDRAMGVVPGDWARSTDRHARLTELAARIRADHGVSAVYLADGKSRIVASSRDGVIRLY
jgi:hypothetical protein